MEETQETPEVRNQTRTCENCGKLIYNSEQCSCKTDPKDRPKWMQEIISETQEKGKITNGNIG
jgi:hypothetical protein